MSSKTAKAGEQAPVEAVEAARHAVDVASDKQASDVLLLELRELAAFADYMVIMSAGSPRQINSLAEDLADAVEKTGLPLHHREGTAESGWVLLDFADLVIHVFSEAQRDFYGLEQLWRAAKVLVRVQ